MLRILLQIRPDARDRAGGDTVVMYRTAEFLRAVGHEVVISVVPEPNLGGFDVVHLFNLTRPYEAYLHALRARRSATPYVLSPIYWDLHDGIPWRAYQFPRNWCTRLTPIGLRRRLHRHLLFRDVRSIQADVARGAHFVFPGSRAEQDHLISSLGDLRGARLRIVPHGVFALSKDTRRHEGSLDVRNAFLCAGSIGPRKNQLGLVKAFRSLPEERLVILGNVAAGCGRYWSAVQRAAGSNVMFHAAVEHDAMSAVLKTTLALVQPSFVETPGLAAMEAAAAGLPIVVADFPPVREYLGEGACRHYCNPSDSASVARACRAALAEKRGDGNEFRLRYDWNRVLKPMAEAYAEFESGRPTRAQGRWPAGGQAR